MSKNRISPNEHASKLPIGKVMVGNNGAKWIVIERKNGSHHWAPLSPENKLNAKAQTDNKEIENPTVKDLQNITAIEYNRPDQKTYKIFFGEIATSFAFEDKYHMTGDTFQVNKEFYPELQKPPWILAKVSSIAYVFGEYFPLKEYKLKLYHDNDAAQTGFVDMTAITKKEMNRIDNYNLWLKIYGTVAGKNFDWADRESLLMARQKISPRILFVGHTRGGDVGAALFVHHNKMKQIDSLIIDVNHLFELS